MTPAGVSGSKTKYDKTNSEKVSRIAHCRLRLHSCLAFQLASRGSVSRDLAELLDPLSRSSPSAALGLRVWFRFTTARAWSIGLWHGLSLGYGLGERVIFF